MANELDELMSRDPLSLSAQDLDQIIAYHRRARAMYESGVKPKKGGDGPKVDLSGLMQNLLPKAPAAPFKRRA